MRTVVDLPTASWPREAVRTAALPYAATNVEHPSRQFPGLAEALKVLCGYPMSQGRPGDGVNGVEVVGERGLRGSGVGATGPVTTTTKLALTIFGCLTRRPRLQILPEIKPSFSGAPKLNDLIEGGFDRVDMSSPHSACRHPCGCPRYSGRTSEPCQRLADRVTLVTN